MALWKPTGELSRSAAQSQPQTGSRSQQPLGLLCLVCRNSKGGLTDAQRSLHSGPNRRLCFYESPRISPRTRTALIITCSLNKSAPAKLMILMRRVKSLEHVRVRDSLELAEVRRKLADIGSHCNQRPLGAKFNFPNFCLVHYEPSSSFSLVTFVQATNY